jgi:hypothetical protein
MARYQAIGARLIQTSVARQFKNDEKVTALFKRTITAMGASLPQRQIALLTVSNPSTQQAPDYCVAIIGLYQQILKAPPMESAAMLRSLMKG